MAGRSRSSSAKRKREQAQSASGKSVGSKKSKTAAKEASKNEEIIGDGEDEEEVVNMADVSGYSRYSVDTTMMESETEEEANMSGLTDRELTNDSIGKATRKGHKDDDYRQQKMVRIPVRRRVEGNKGDPRSRMARAKVPSHPMIYERQSYNSTLPTWEDIEPQPVVRRGYLAYINDDDIQKEGDEEGIVWRDVGYFSTEDRRRLHGDYHQYFEMQQDSAISSPGDTARNQRSGRRYISPVEVNYSLTAHILSMVFVFFILLITFLMLQYLDVWGQFKDTLWITYYSLYELYTSLSSGSYSFTCQVGGSPFQMVECEIKQSFNRLLLSTVTQCVQFVNAAMKVDNVPHAVALLAGAYSALSAFVWSIKWPILYLSQGTLAILTGAYNSALRVCHNSGF